MHNLCGGSIKSNSVIYKIQPRTMSIYTAQEIVTSYLIGVPLSQEIVLVDYYVGYIFHVKKYKGFS